MSESKPNVFKGNLSTCTAVDIDAPLSASEPDPASVAECFHKASESAGEPAQAVYSFLSQVCSIGESFDVGVRPFSPLMQGPEGRTLMPEDLTKKDLIALFEFAKRSTHPVLQARLFDIIWTETNDHTACAEAVKGYLARAKLNDTDERWFRTQSSFQRAAQLAGRLGRTKPLSLEALDALVTAARDETIDVGGARNARLMWLMLRLRTGDPPEFAARAARLAVAARKVGKLELTQQYLEIESDWHKMGDDAAKEKAARLAAGELMVEIAERRNTGPIASAMAAAGLLVDAIEALRKAGAEPARIESLRQRLGNLQQKSRDEMGQFSHSFDITDQVKAAEAHVANRPFHEAVMRFAFGIKLTNPVQLRKDVLELAKQNPFSSLIDAAIVDEKGRTIAREPGLFGKSGEALESALEVKMFSHTAQFIWRPRVSSYINPARMQMVNDHQPTFDDIFAIVRNNPFVPPGHEAIFLRGLHAGFHGDFIVAVHLLVPQVENSVRHLLETQGVDVSNLMSDKTQPVKILSGLLALEPAKKVLGASLHFEIRGHLLEKTGFSFRNQVAHGFVNEADCYSAPALATWWLVLRLCLHFAISGGREVSDEEEQI